MGLSGSDGDCSGDRGIDSVIEITTVVAPANVRAWDKE